MLTLAWPTVLASYRMPPSTRYDFVRFLLYSIYRYRDSKTVRGTEPSDMRAGNIREDEPEASPSPTPTSPRRGVSETSARTSRRRVRPSPTTASQPQPSITHSMIRKQEGESRRTRGQNESDVAGGRHLFLRGPAGTTADDWEHVFWQMTTPEQQSDSTSTVLVRVPYNLLT